MKVKREEIPTIEGLIMDRLLLFKGKVIGITKVKNKDGMAIRVTLDTGFYFEIPDIKDNLLFKKLCEIELEKMITVKVEI